MRALVALVAVLLSGGCFYGEKDLERARQDGYEDGFDDGFRKSRTVQIEVSGSAYAEGIDDYVEVSESCTVEIAGEDAESDCEF